jgi:hypothetical protein
MENTPAEVMNSVRKYLNRGEGWRSDGSMGEEVRGEFFFQTLVREEEVLPPNPFEQATGM